MTYHKAAVNSPSSHAATRPATVPTIDLSLVFSASSISKKLQNNHNLLSSTSPPPNPTSKPGKQYPAPTSPSQLAHPRESPVSHTHLTSPQLSSAQLSSAQLSTPKMSERIPESIPTSAAPSRRPKKRAPTSTSTQAATISSLFAKPEAALASSSHLIRPGGASQPPEIVANVQGSSAGAGSGEFHVYKASRRREYERLRQMDAEVAEEAEGEVYEREREEREGRDREVTERKRKRREKMKARKGKGGKAEEAGGEKMEGVKVGGMKPRVEAGTAAETTEEGRDAEINARALVAVQEAGLVIHDDD